MSPHRKASRCILKGMGKPNPPLTRADRIERTCLIVMVAGFLAWFGGMTLGFSPLGQLVPAWAWDAVGVAILAGIPVGLVGLIALILVQRRPGSNGKC